ncbi:hypothetical protein HMPREF0103_1564 [Bacteroides sp. 2_1_33B]|nr:hypothetical protein HMPREF0103_1564 [Bacteroides sp. 2_1_33B]
MKIAILTYSSAYNYGAILQCYALQEKIKMMGHSCAVINYQCRGIIEQYAFQKKLNIASVKRNVFWLLSFFKRNKMDRFRQNLQLTKPLFKSDILKIEKDYDCFIVGSDQVWNKDCTNGDETFFLDFIKDSKKKNSYAASFGKISIDPMYEDRYRILLSSFNNISLREKTGVDIVKKMTGRECVNVLDPVFLISRKDWMKFVYPIEGKYIFVYQLVSDLSTLKYAYCLSKHLGYKLYIYSSEIHAIIYGEVLLNMGVEDFLSYIRNAELVITDSFHCSAFSIIFNTQFYSKLRVNDSANTRIEGLLNMFNIKSRLLDVENDASIDRIDYSVVNDILDEEQKQSNDFLNLIFDESIKKDANESSVL